MYMKKLTSQVVMTYDDPVADTKYGKVRGLKTDGTYIFRGIRYAKAKRFHMPEEPDKWEGVKGAYSFGYVCSELNTPIAHDNDTVQHFYYPQNEHCQYLNIWTQHLDKSAKRPVMVWLHGGGWFSGSSVELISYDGENLSAYGDVVVVSVNHRLNVLGYLDLSEYGEEYANSGNVGLADLVASLKWVKENIENFGGDPDNVTIFGQSGGGGKVAYLLQTPAADGLYHRGIIQSGGTFGHGGADEVRHCGEVSRLAAKRILERLHIAPENVKEIETVPWEDLAQATMEAIWLIREEDGEEVSWEPVYDGKYFMGDPVDMGYRKETIGTPMIIGTCFSEFAGTHDRNYDEQPKALWSEEKADAIIADAQARADRIVSESEVMQKALEQSNQLLEQTNAQAQELIDNATTDSNNIRMSAISYTDEMLENLEKIMNHTMDSAGQKYNNFINSIQSCLDIVTRNRSELSPQGTPSNYSMIDDEPEEEEEE